MFQTKLACERVEQFLARDSPWLGATWNLVGERAQHEHAARLEHARQLTHVARTLVVRHVVKAALIAVNVELRVGAGQCERVRAAKVHFHGVRSGQLFACFNRTR